MWKFPTPGSARRIASATAGSHFVYFPFLEISIFFFSPAVDIVYYFIVLLFLIAN